MPAAGAITAAVGVTAEYKGKIAVADGKEVAATAISTIAEAEMLLAKAERIKASRAVLFLSSSQACGLPGGHSRAVTSAHALAADWVTVRDAACAD